MGKQIIINHIKHEIRIAVVENGIVTELFYERERKKSVVGNIYKGKVLKVLPGMESAFVDIGLEKAGFLYVDDIWQDKDDENLLEDEAGESDKTEDENPEELGKKRQKKRSKQSISSLIKEGQEIMVQVSKGPIGTKGARITCNVTLPGRNLVFIPRNSNSVGVSRQIREEKERSRLRRIVSSLKPEGTGFIIRTVADGRSEEEFKLDIEYLRTTMREAERAFKTNRSPSLIYEDLNLNFRMIRDMLSKEISSIIIDNPNEFDKIQRYLSKYLPRYKSILKLYKRKTPIFDHFGVTVEIDKALGRKVWLKSGGSLVIDQSEALTAIDVNTGRFTGSNSHEETIVTTNLEAAVEIVHQLKIRDIGGIIIIDFIDMEQPENRQKVFTLLKEELKNDKARTKALPISEMGLVEMTRKRIRENLGRYLRVVCPYCDGSAGVRSPATTIYDIYREIEHLSQESNVPQNLILVLHPDVAEALEAEEAETFKSMNKLIHGSIKVQTSNRHHYEQYELFEL